MKILNFYVIGEHQIGKTTLINTFITFTFQEIGPTVFNNHTKHFLYKNEEIWLTIWDLVGCDAEYRKIRIYNYDNIDAFLVCFSIDIKQSLESAEKKWIPEIKEECPEIPFILAGMKNDLRKCTYQNEKMDLINTKEGKCIAKKTGACCYIECSSKNRFNVDELFEKATEVSLNSLYKRADKNKTKNKNCIIF